MKSIIHWGLISSICLFGLSSFAEVYLPFAAQPEITSFCGLLILIFAFIYLPPKRLLLPLFIILLAGIINITSIDEPMYQVAWEGLRQMESLIALLIVVPIVGWILAEEPYIEGTVAFFSDALSTSKRFFVWIMAITQVISYFLLFGCIPMVYQIVQKIIGQRQGEAWDNFKSTAISRSFGLSAVWVISMPSFIVAIDSMGASLGLAILQGFFFAVVGIVLSMLFFHFREKKYTVDLTQGIQEEIQRVIPSKTESKHSKRLVLEFLFLFFSLFGIVLLLNHLLDWNLLIIIPSVVVFWTLLYYIAKRKLNVLFDKGKQYLSGGLITRAPEITILVSAGLLINSLHVSGLGYSLVDGLFYLTSLVPFLNPLMVLPFILVSLGFLGLGPLMVMVLVGGILQTMPLPYPPELIVLSLTLGSALSMMISPLVIAIIVLSSSNGLSLVQNSLKYNLAYACVLYLVVQAYIQGFVWLFDY